MVTLTCGELANVNGYGVSACLNTSCLHHTTTLVSHSLAVISPPKQKYKKQKNKKSMEPISAIGVDWLLDELEKRPNVNRLWLQHCNLGNAGMCSEQLT